MDTEPTSAQPATQRDESGQLTVFITVRESSCDECGQNLERSPWITLTGERLALCLQCADLDHLVFLPSGDAALTRRARRRSVLSAVVVRWSRARNRYERQGVLVEAEALERAEAECLTDADARARRREREAAKRSELDVQHARQFAAHIRSLFPRCPKETAKRIADHACLKSSGRIGRSRGGRELEEMAVRLAVVAHVRHAETEYDVLLARGYDRHEARAQVAATVDRALALWEGEP